ncbi:calpain-7-like isoform X2 [Oratosquilla oratoria]
MGEVEELMTQAAGVAQQATQLDTAGSTAAAAYAYYRAVELLQRALEHGAPSASILPHVQQYQARAQQLEHAGTSGRVDKVVLEDGHGALYRAKFLLNEALELDESGMEDQALEVYTEAVQLCLNASKEVESETMQERLKMLSLQALNRAEVIKAAKDAGSSKAVPATKPSGPATYRVPPLGLSLGVDAEEGASSSKESQSGSSTYTKEELAVLRATSTINGRQYVPFMAVDLREKFSCSLPFQDRDGELALSPKQRKNFVRWVRPEEISSEPTMIQEIDCFSIKQTCVSDCSFVASLAVSALYEKRFKKRLITDIIYPKTRSGQPVYNPCGKYMIKLHINGIPRKVLIDDCLPQGEHGQLLCSYSTNKSEFWISLIEKAYMKVMGGYDFPGSNSNIDLFALTGWIPERVSISEKEFNKEKVFNKILDRMNKGDVLVTVATGEMSDAAAERAGLVPTHAYALLDIRQVKVGGQTKRLLLLKNPWSHLRWKGNYSELDQRSWTPELCKALQYDPKSAKAFDDGVFWIDYDSLCHFFDVIYMNWNPALFGHTYCTHKTWLKQTGPARDLYNIGENPQYKLEVRCGSGGAAVWVLLTRHITEIQDFKENTEYITLVIYKNNGRRVFYPYDPSPYLDGVRINSPHYLCRMTLPEGTHTFTLVVSQYEKNTTIHYSLRVYASCPFSLGKLPDLPKNKFQVEGRWAGETAGGCPNHPATYKNNPVYQLRIEKDMPSVCFQLKAPKEVQIGLELVCIEARNTEAKGYFTKKQSGAYRSGFVVLEVDRLVAGVYNIIPSTFMPNTEAPYFLVTLASTTIKMNRLR